MANSHSAEHTAQSLRCMAHRGNVWCSPGFTYVTRPHSTAAAWVIYKVTLTVLTPHFILETDTHICSDCVIAVLHAWDRRFKTSKKRISELLLPAAEIAAARYQYPCISQHTPTSFISCLQCGAATENNTEPSMCHYPWKSSVQAHLLYNILFLLTLMSWWCEMVSFWRHFGFEVVNVVRMSNLQFTWHGSSST